MEIVAGACEYSITPADTTLSLYSTRYEEFYADVTRLHAA